MRVEGRTYRQTDRNDEANCRFRNFSNAPNNGLSELTQTTISVSWYENCRSQWPCDLKRWFAAVRFFGLRVWIPPGARTFFCCQCCVLSARGVCVGLITCPEESYWVWCVCHKFSIMRRPWATGGCWAIYIYIYIYIYTHTHTHTYIYIYIYIHIYIYREREKEKCIFNYTFIYLVTTSVDTLSLDIR